ncbi:MAG: hypothetical protein V1899_10340, partial [Planctomycetota bacterium]
MSQIKLSFSLRCLILSALFAASLVKMCFQFCPWIDCVSIANCIGPASCFDVTADGAVIVVHDGKHIRSINIRTGKNMAMIVARAENFCTVSVSPDGKWICAETISNNVQVFDSATGDCAWQI